MATLDSFRNATGDPIRLDLANGYIADIRLNAGDVNGRTINNYAAVSLVRGNHVRT